LRCWKTHGGASWCVEGAREAFSWWLLKRKVGSDAEEDSKVHLGCWKVQGSLWSSLGGFGNRVMVVSGSATWPIVEARFAGAKVGLEAFGVKFGEGRKVMMGCCILGALVGAVRCKVGGWPGGGVHGGMGDDGVKL